MQSAPQSCIRMIVFTGLGCRGTKADGDQDDQINCLSILSIFVKQRTYLATLPNRFEKYFPGRPRCTLDSMVRPSLKERRTRGGIAGDQTIAGTL
jgi:hypothetical protein